jgi:hypothetical protein
MWEKILNIRWYRVVLQLPKFNAALQRVNKITYKEGNRGFPVMRSIRKAWYNLGIEYNKVDHKYEILEPAGNTSDFSARELFEYLKSAINKTVPFSLIGKKNIIVGEREQNGWTTAGFGGPVQTTHDDDTLEMWNFAGETHVFAGGYVYIKIYEQNDKVYIYVKGYGTNNFAEINKKYGKILFQNMVDSNIAEYQKLIAKRKK